MSTAWLVFLVEPLSSTGMAFPFFFVTFAGTILFGTVCLALALTRRPFERRILLAWLAHPLAATSLLLLFLLSQTPLNPLFRLRFHFSRSALEEAALIAMSHKTPATPAWVGLFPVHRIDVDDPEVRFLSDGCGVADECGLLYRSGPMPTGRSKTRVKHIGGNWYHLYAVF